MATLARLVRTAAVPSAPFTRAFAASVARAGTAAPPRVVAAAAVSLRAAPAPLVARGYATEPAKDGGKAKEGGAPKDSNQPVEAYVEPLKDADVQHFAFAKEAHPLEGTKMDEHLQRPKKKKLSYMLHQPAYTPEELMGVEIRHEPVRTIADRLAFWAIKTLRSSFDTVTGYGRVPFNEDKWLQRMIFLETVAGVPGMVGGMLRHLRSLVRPPERDATKRDALGTNVLNGGCRRRSVRALPMHSAA